MAQTPGERRRRWRWTLRLAVLATALALMVAFIAQNFVIVEVRLFAWSVELHLAWAVAIAALAGVLTGLLLPRLWR